MTNTTDEIVIYKSEDGAIKLDVLFEKIWKFRIFSKV